jgi:8-oxo-dGTP pyrophosphatase MutT (NUDIX family)
VLNALLTGYQAVGETEAADVERMRRLAVAAPDPWSRSQLPLHFTASALVLHPDSRRVLLRWHVRQGRWLGVGGHGDPGESDPLQIALREAREESGLADLVPWPPSSMGGGPLASGAPAPDHPRRPPSPPDGALRHAVVCYVRPSAAEPEHEHADLRYLFATSHPDAIAAEDEHSPLRWVTFPQARALFGADNLTDTLDRAERLLDAAAAH